MKKTILIVEDDFDIQEYYKIVFSECELNLDILQAYNGKEALQLVKLHKDEIILIILDLKMPIMDGEEFLKILRNEMKISIPVIVSTVNNYSIERLTKESDVQGFFYKMDKQDELLNLIKKICNL